MKKGIPKLETPLSGGKLTPLSGGKLTPLSGVKKSGGKTTPPLSGVFASGVFAWSGQRD